MTMDALTFFAVAIKALAWPVAAVVMAFIFKKDLRDIFERFRKGKVGGVELELAEKVAEGIEFSVKVQEAAEDNVLPVSIISNTQTSTNLLHGEHSRSMILGAWLGVESAVNRLAARTNLVGTNPQRSMRSVESAGIVSPEDMSLFYDLRALRNAAAHNKDFSLMSDAATTFIGLAASLTARLDSYAQGESFVIRRRKSGEYSFSLRAANGQTILSSEGYSAKPTALNGVEATRKSSQVPDRFQRKTAANGTYFFNLVAENGQVIGTSELYANEAGRDMGIEAVARIARTAPIDDLAP